MFVKYYITGKMTSQNFGSLLTMKVFDRALEEGNDDLLKLIVEKFADGFAKKNSHQRSSKMQEKR